MPAVAAWTLFITPLTAKTLRPASEAGFAEKPNLGHQGGSCISLSKYSKNKDPAWTFMQSGCCKEIMIHCILIGGFAPMPNSSFAEARVKAKAKVAAGTTRHLETVKYVIDNAMATEPHMPLRAGFSTNELPTELGKLLTGQACDGDAKKCMDAVAAQIDAKVKDAGLLARHGTRNSRRRHQPPSLRLVQGTMTKDLIIGIDSSTTSTKASAWTRAVMRLLKGGCRLRCPTRKAVISNRNRMIGGRRQKRPCGKWRPLSTPRASPPLRFPTSARLLARLQKMARRCGQV